jgi:hypothetical protein
MLEVLEFIFGSFWRWIGTVILLLAICPWNHIYLGTVDCQNKKTKD